MKKLNMLIVLASITLLCGSVQAMQAKQTNYTKPSLSNSVVDPSVPQHSNEQLRLAKDQLCKSDRETGIVRCNTYS